MKVTAPMMSLDASGTFAGVFTAGRFRGRSYMRKKPTPHQAWTPAQRSHYVRLAFLQASWNLIPIHTPAGMQAEWQPIADDYGLPLFQAFVKYNYARFSPTEGPRITPTGGGAGGLNNTLLSKFGGHGLLGCIVNNPNNNNLFGTIVYVKEGAVPTGEVSEIGYIQTNYKLANTNTSIQITHLPPGTYNIRSKSLKTDGTLTGFTGLLTTIVVT